MLVFTKATKVYMKHKFSLHDETKSTKHIVLDIHLSHSTHL